LVAASLGFVVFDLVRDWRAATNALNRAELWWLLPAGVLAVAAMMCMAWRWGAAIEALGGRRGPSRRVIAAFFVGESAKYVPGGIWSVVGRSEIGRSEGRSRAVSYASVVLSLVACYLAAAVIALVLGAISLALGTVDVSWWPVLVAVVLIGVAVLHPGAQRRLLSLVRRVFRRRLELNLPSWTTCVRLTASYLPTWVGIAAATTVVARALDPHPPLARVALAAVVSWVVGFVSPAPGGIGVREAVFIAAAGLPAGPAAAAAVLARLVFVLVDVLGALFGWLSLRARPNQPQDDVGPPIASGLGAGRSDAIRAGRPTLR
jgi:uncharacterized membrane protein YbhN (UPF0104 family)